MTARVPPHSTEAEQAVLGGLMLAPECLATVGLTEEDFYRRDHAMIFAAIAELDRVNQPFDVVTLGDYLDSQGLSDQIGKGGYLIQLASTTPSAANIEAYAEIVRDKAVLRRLITAGSAMVDEAFEAQGRASAEILDRGIGQMMLLAKQEARHEVSMHEGLRDTMRDMHEAYSASGELRGVPTGFARIDARLGGFHPGDFVLVGARPKMGKTAMMINLMRNAATKGLHCGVISGEQSSKQLIQRMLSLETGVPAERMRNGNLEEEDWGRLTGGVERLMKQRIHICDDGGPSIDQVRRLARKWKQAHNISVLYVDYLQRLRWRKAKDRVEEVGEVARGLKDIARDLNIPVIALAQVKRDVETRKDKRPEAADIANSDEATREADQILMLYREAVYYDSVNENGQAVRKGVAELNIEANRHGPTGQFELGWSSETMRFSDLDSGKF